MGRGRNGGNRRGRISAARVGTVPGGGIARTPPDPSRRYTGVANNGRVQDMYYLANGGGDRFGNFAYIGARDFRSAHRIDDTNPDPSSVTTDRGFDTINYQTGIDFKTGWRNTRMNIALESNDTFTVRLYTHNPSPRSFTSKVRRTVDNVYADNVGQVMVDMYNGFVSGQRAGR
jgi:hypothetical protein